MHMLWWKVMWIKQNPKLEKKLFEFSIATVIKFEKFLSEKDILFNDSLYFQSISFTFYRRILNNGVFITIHQNITQARFAFE